jgi:hypothetical protein
MVATLVMEAVTIAAAEPIRLANQICSAHFPEVAGQTPAVPHRGRFFDITLHESWPTGAYYSMVSKHISPHQFHCCADRAWDHSAMLDTIERGQVPLGPAFLNALDSTWLHDLARARARALYYFDRDPSIAETSGHCRTEQHTDADI